MTTDTLPAADVRRVEWGRHVQQQGALVALVALLLFGALRYDNFLGANIESVLVDDVKYGLVALGMTLVIMTGGIDLSVGSVVLLGGVVAAQTGEHGLVVAFAAGTAAGLAVGLLNAVLITRAHLQPFVATLATLLFNRGLRLWRADGAPVATPAGDGFHRWVIFGV